MPRSVPKKSASWATKIDDAEWAVCDSVLQAVTCSGISFSLGGALALASYTGRWRDMKDLDLHVLPRDRHRIIKLLAGLGMRDYFEQHAYDRRWIYRATADGVIVDVIWAMANQRAQVDEWWISGPEINVRGRPVRVAPPEVILWDKLYIMQRERCDWPDIMNLLYAVGPHLDWESVIERLGDDIDLLAGALTVFRWISPGVARRLPRKLWSRVKLSAPSDAHASKILPKHASWLDTRPWYGPPDRQDKS